MQAQVKQLDSRHITAPAFEAWIVMGVVLVMPLAMYLGGYAAHSRIPYLAMNCVVAGWLFARRSPWYAAHCLLLFCCVSLVRRWIDEQAGWDPSNPVLLAPYICCLFTVISFIEYWSRPQPRYLGRFLLLMLCVGYGAVLAILNDRLLGTAADVLKWTVGPLFAVHILATCETASETRRVVESCLIYAATAMSLYGIVQFVEPPSWDIVWMRGAAELGLDSIGQPEPFSVRVFSTMNSPGSFGAVVSAALVVALRRRPTIAIATVPAMAVGLALCQYRSLWAATAVAIFMVLLSRRAAVRFDSVLALIVIGVLLCSTAVAPRVREAIVQRASSLTALKGDQSLNERLEQYAALTRNDDLVIGEGLSIRGATRRFDKQTSAVLDGALIEIWRALGVIVGTVFLLCLGAIVAPLFGAGSSGIVAFDRAIVVALFLQLPIGSVHIGEVGFCAWMFIGFALAMRVQVKCAEPAAMPALQEGLRA